MPGLGAELHFRGRQSFILSQKQVSPGLQVQMQALNQCHPLNSREVRKHVHAENAVKLTQEGRLGEVHVTKPDQVAKSRLGQEMLTHLDEVGLHQRDGD